MNPNGSAIMTIADFRNGNHFNNGETLQQIPTSCPVVQLLLDDLFVRDKRDLLPRDSMVVTLTETGNRDEFVIRYLSAHGYTNLHGIRFGMRGWIKNKFPAQ